MALLLEIILWVLFLGSILWLIYETVGLDVMRQVRSQFLDGLTRALYGVAGALRRARRLARHDRSTGDIEDLATLVERIAAAIVMPPPPPGRGLVSWNVPVALSGGDTRDVEVRIANAAPLPLASQRENMHGGGPTYSREIHVTGRMAVRLLSAGDTVTVLRVSTEEQDLPPRGFASWLFRLKAEETAGWCRLDLVVSMVTPVRRDALVLPLDLRMTGRTLAGLYAMLATRVRQLALAAVLSGFALVCTVFADEVTKPALRTAIHWLGWSRAATGAGPAELPTTPR